MMNWNQLAEMIAAMSEEQRNTTVTVFMPDDDEWYGISDVFFTTEDDVLDRDHPFMEVYQGYIDEE